MTGDGVQMSHLIFASNCFLLANRANLPQMEQSATDMVHWSETKFNTRLGARKDSQRFCILPAMTRPTWCGEFNK